MIESPSEIGRVQLECGSIGAFTTINMRAVSAEANNCVLECQSIGRFCMLSHAVNIGFVNHPTNFISSHIFFRYDKKTENMYSYKKIRDHNVEQKLHDKYILAARKELPIIKNDVWIGYGATILNNVTVGNGAIIGACSVVTKDVPPYAIVAGNPAKIIRMRFSDSQIEQLETIKWWEYGPDIMNGLDISLVDCCISELNYRIQSGKYTKIENRKVRLNIKENIVSID